MTHAMGTSWGIPRGEKWFNDEGVVSSVVLLLWTPALFLLLRRYELKYVAAPGTRSFLQRKSMQLKRRQYYYCFATLLLQPKHCGVFDDKIRKIHQFVVVCTWCLTPVCSYFTKKIICRHQKYIFCCICLHRSGLRYRRPPELEKLGPIPQKHITIEPSEVQWSGQAKVQFQVQGDFPGKKISGCRLSHHSTSVKPLFNQHS